MKVSEFGLSKALLGSVNQSFLVSQENSCLEEAECLQGKATLS